MRQCAVRVPHWKRKWRLVSSLVEDGLLTEAESEESVGVEESEEELSETEEDLSFLDEESEVSETESSQTEAEEEGDWYGLIEV